MKIRANPNRIELRAYRAKNGWLAFGEVETDAPGDMRRSTEGLRGSTWGEAIEKVIDDLEVL